MAELIIGSVLNSLARQLAPLVSREIELARGVKPELQKLRSTLSVIRGKLREAEKRQVEAVDLKEWLKQLEDVLYDADDLVDDFSTTVLSHPGATGRGKRILRFFSSSNQYNYARKMAHKVKEIRERINSILDDGDRLQVGTSNLGVEKLFIRPETHPFEAESFLIGRDEDKKKVIEFLLNPDFEDNVSILPIVGVGGLGKTTLARLAFNEESVQEYFELKLWLCVSTNFNVEDILKKIVRDIVKKKPVKHEEEQDGKKDMRKISQEYTIEKELEKLNRDELQKKLREELDGKKFLIVLDDVWNENRRKWLDLEENLKKGAKGSKILVTTRSSLVADTMRAGPHYRLSGLPEDKSLSLLMRMARKQEPEWRNRDLEGIAKDILKKCTGVPLAIMTIGRLLLSRNTEEDWLKFKNNEISRIDQEEGDIMPTLKLSYDFLPSHLKRCFSYCSLFPKDYALEPDELIHLWMAQGFIKPLSNRQTIEEAGHDYFLELLSRSFFQDVEYDIWGNILRCKMHDLMHDLAELVAGDDYVTIDGSHMNEFPDEARHVSIVATEDYEWSGFERDNGRVRSLLLIVEKTNRIGIGHLDVSCFTNLRSLRLPYAGIKKISRSIGKMEHLRNLDLSGNDQLRNLPNSINKLRNLETLNLNSCWELKRLPSGITKLVNLRQLDVRGCSDLAQMPRGIGKLTNLQTLGTFVVGQKWNPKAARCTELCELVRLRKELEITHLERLASVSSELEASLTIEKLALQSLELQWDRYSSKKLWEALFTFSQKDHSAKVLERLRPDRDLKRLTIKGYPGDGLSSWFSQLHKLVQIEIDWYEGSQLPHLDQLRFLKRISLRYSSSLESIELSESGRDEESGTEQPNLFPCLEEIELMRLPNFRGWERKRGGNRIDEQNDDDDSVWALPRFSDKVKVSIINTDKMVQWLLEKNVAAAGQDPLPLVPQLPIAEPTPPSGKMTMIPISSLPLSMLTSLALKEMRDVERLPVGLFQHLSSLQSLVIVDCNSLKALPVRTILRCLPNLEKLEVSSCKELDLEDDGGEPEELEGTAKLRRLLLHRIDKMQTLPWWMQHLTSLESLDITFCRNLKAFPEWFSNLTSLERLRVDYCGKGLRRRLQGKTGKDWPKISQIVFLSDRRH